MTRKRRNRSISVSFLNIFLECFRKGYYNYYTDVPKKLDYARLCGQEVHRFIPYYLYKPLGKKSEPRTFFYKTIASAMKTWWRVWNEALEEKGDKIILPNDEQAKRYGEIGVICIAQYWKDNVNLSRPIQQEKLYKSQLLNGIILGGRFDQVREVSLKYIKRHRKEIVINGKLREDFNAVVIVDLKTNNLSFDTRQFKEDPTLEEEIRQQYELHENLQATVYSFLYEQQTGKKPIGFVWYHLRSGKGFFTYREERDYLNLFGIIDHVMDNIAVESFPKRAGRHCRYCDYLEACHEDRCFLLSQPEGLGENLTDFRLIPNKVYKEKTEQLKLKLQLPRRIREKARITPAREEYQIILRDLPWDTDERIMKLMPKKTVQLG